MPELIKLCALADIAEGTARGFAPEGGARDTMFVVRKDGQLHGYRNSCPHIPGAAMAWRKDAYLSHDGEYIVCAGHGARFAIADGHCLFGACLGQSLTPVELTVKAGSIWASSQDSPPR